MELIYKNKAWVIIDGDDNGKAIISKLQNNYKEAGWTVDHFMTLSKTNVEEYYPEAFKDDVTAIQQIITHKDRQPKKIQLINKVTDWIAKNEEDAKKQFEVSANEVIEKLRKIESELNKTKE